MNNSTISCTSVLATHRESTRTALAASELPLLWLAMKCTLPLLFSLLFFLALPSRVSAQEGGRFEVGADYNFVRANAGPDACGCFTMQGGDAWIGWHLTDHLSFVAQGALHRATNINGTTASLTLTSFMTGPRLNFRPTHRITPFVQGLFGVSHGSGLLTPVPATGLSGTANSLAISAGGGIDFILTRAVAIRVIQVDYFHTRFDNGVNQSQNNIRLSAGILVHF
jgi:outer membrane immunogenic protein